MSRTLFDKLWDRHVITGPEGEPQLLYVDLHLIHEVTSPQGFDGLRETNRPVRRPDKTIATVDHNVPTEDIYNIKDLISKKQIEALQKNCAEFNIPLMDIGTANQGIVHMVGPELGATQPGKIVVCGDSHTATHGAFGAMAFGIGSSEVEHVFATQSIWQKKPKSMGVKITGKLPAGVYAKDIILHLIATYGAAFGSGYAIEFYGDTVEALTMEERMTICNMSIEFGAKIGMMAPDQTTYDYLRGRRYAPENMEKAIADWETLKSDPDAVYDTDIAIDVSDLAPYVTWGTNPGMGVQFGEKFPEIQDKNDERAYNYMDLKPGQTAEDIPLGFVFIGSCTNARLSDLIEAAKYVKGGKVPAHIQAMVVPGSRTVRDAAAELGLDKIFIDAGFEWREPGCSACLGMNPDKVPAGVHCASTSNRNFEGRQGKGSRTHLVSPAMAGAAAVNGKFVDIRKEAVTYGAN
ncbi:MAG: 3-isopropylmalate dehydratase large subunit [Trichococcus flocculiformis]|uniref:3-isopropylmalate dehydratase large subunit n=1 Tax=Trichococcus flocculiformis TaxID=82803 RepID=A0AB38BKE2_9LACT|nr:3-isopropylmalate dehydratase large subunit [Trichococcus flocculiformis]CZQ85813.1 3-isopropylmalate dehydratase large subunit [Trichococcus flocculiformis]SFI07011.1 3-isopropylmalate dehydratase, large subunit [Trichococcus flocculiformis]